MRVIKKKEMMLIPLETTALVITGQIEDTTALVINHLLRQMIVPMIGQVMRRNQIQSREKRLKEGPLDETEEDHGKEICVKFIGCLLQAILISAFPLQSSTE